MKQERARCDTEAGITLIEVLIAGALIAIAACAMAALLTGSLGMTAVNKETAQARTAARRMLEELQNVPPGDVYATFNNLTEDDPLGEATAPGSIFSIQMKPAAIQVSNMTGTIIFPENTGQLREDVKDATLGMPRDLNGDGVIDSENHAQDYVLLPVRIRVEWRGMTGERSYDLHTVLLNK
ncbi:MAG: hypothetical protein ABFS86_03555 [Planctomycetota bacterium]